MLIYNRQVRLTASERDQLAALTGADTGYIKTVDQLVSFIQIHIARQRVAGRHSCLARRLLACYLPPAQRQENAG